MTDLATAYRGVRVRVREIVLDHGDQCDAVIPATPDWTVHDVVAHLAGITADIVSGNLNGVGTDPWAAQQVAARKHRDLDELLDEWDTCAASVEPMIDAFGDAGGQLLFDAATHEQDLRGALACPGARDSDALVSGFDWVARNVGATRSTAGAGPLLVEHEGGTTVCGDGPPSATVRISRFEFTRAVGGRRSVEQIERYEWDGDARSELLVLPRFTPRLAPLVE